MHALTNLVALGAAVVLACVACGWGGFATTVGNESADALIVFVSEEGRSDRFYPVRPGATVLLDTVGHHNRPASAILLLDRTCTLRQEVVGDFGEGGVLTVTDHGAQFSPGQSSWIDIFTLRGPDEAAGAEASCPGAADALAN